jgi:hypothetical protein
MKKTISVISLLTLSLLISGCNLPGESEPTADIIATQVAQMLTESAEKTQLISETPAPTLTATEAIIEATPSITSTATSTPTATKDQSDPATQLGSPAWTQDFNNSSSAWDFDYEKATFETKDGYLTLTAKSIPNWHSWYVSSPKLKNAYVEATIQMSNCSGLDRFGLAVRASSDGQQFYYMGITCDGQWGFFRMAENVNINEIKAYQSAEPLNDNMAEPHRVGIWMEDSSFTFYIDGEEVGIASDNTLTNEGFTGFMITFSNTPGFTVKVDKLSYWNVP